MPDTLCWTVEIKMLLFQIQKLRLYCFRWTDSSGNKLQSLSTWGVYLSKINQIFFRCLKICLSVKFTSHSDLVSHPETHSRDDQSLRYVQSVLWLTIFIVQTMKKSTGQLTWHDISSCCTLLSLRRLVMQLLTVAREHLAHVGHNSC